MNTKPCELGMNFMIGDYMEVPRWEDLIEEEKRSCYESYVGDITYEWGDNAKYMTYEEWCKESEDFGWAIM